jgi:hypothetical protein
MTDGISIPTHVGVSAGSEISSSTSEIEWFSAGGQTVLAYDLDHQRGGELFSTAMTEHTLRFTASATAPFELSGGYNVSDVSAVQSGFIHLFANLLDITGGAYLFENSQTSINTHDEHFTLGETGGDNFNFLFGSLTGTLIAGHMYEFSFNGRTVASPDQDTGAAATGNITFTIGVRASGAAPEPLSMLVWGGLIAAVGLITQRRQMFN